jgi:hypothetical protein
MADRQKIKAFVQDVLGCGCAEEVFEIIELRENGTLIDKSHIGSKGSDEDDENFWYFWSQGDREILQRTGRTILTGKDTLMIKYYYNENMTIQTYNQTAVNDLAARDGTAGFLFYGEDSDNRFSRDTAATYGLNLIAQGTAGVQKKLTFTQRRVYVAPGYKVRVTSTTLGLSGEDFLVQRVRYVGNQFDWQYEIECVNKYCTSDWSNYLGSR